MPPTFAVARADGRNHQVVPYHPIKITAGDVVHTLALHKNDNGSYTVSDPVSGCSVLPRVQGLHKGIPCAVYDYSRKDAEAAAVEQINARVALIGSDRFNSTIANVILTPESQRAADKLRAENEGCAA